MPKMYSPNSPVLSAIDHHSLSIGQHSPAASSQWLRFKYFATFLICTACLALLSASLATHKWIISKPIRVIRLNNGQPTNFTALMLTVSQATGEEPPALDQHQHQRLANGAGSTLSARRSRNQQQQQQPHQNQNQQPASLLLGLQHQATSQQQQQSAAAGHELSFGAGQQNNRFQGEIYFGLFNGVKVLNHGFGDRVSQISVTQSLSGQRDSQQQQTQAQTQQQQELVNFKLWLLTLAGVVLAILFALIGSIFAIINFVMTPRGTLAGPVGLVTWNAAACFSCLLALIAWLIEYFLRLKSNVLAMEEVQNGWTSENRSQFGYSYYFVVLAFVLHLVNIFIVSIVQFETWTSNKALKRQSRAACEGVIMLY